MKKFLGEVSPIDALSELEQRSSMDLNPSNILKLLNTEDYADALAKLYRIISNNNQQFHNFTRFIGIDAFEIHGV